MENKGLAHHKHSRKAGFHHPKSESSPKLLCDLEQIDSCLCAWVSPRVEWGGIALRISRALPSFDAFSSHHPLSEVLRSCPSKWSLWQKVPPRPSVSFSHSQTQQMKCFPSLGVIRKQLAWQLPRKDQLEDVWFWNEPEDSFGMLNLICCCFSQGWWSGAAASPSGLSETVRDGRGQAALCGLCWPSHPRRPLGSMGPVSHQAVSPGSPVPRPFEKYVLTFGAQPGYLCAWKLTSWCWYTMTMSISPCFV